MPFNTGNGKYLENNNGTIQEVAAITASAGASSAGQIPATGPNGQLDQSFMPTGVGPDAQQMTTSETIAAGAFVNVWNNGSQTVVRNADCTQANAGKRADGFVLTGASQAQQALVYFGGVDNALSGLQPGATYFLSSVGSVGASATTTSGQTVQTVGKAISSTALAVTFGTPIVLA